MAKGLVSDTNLTAIANAIRAKNGSSDTYTPATMATAIANIPATDQTTALQYMLNNKTDYTGIAAGLTKLTELPEFTQPDGIVNYASAFAGCSSVSDLSSLEIGKNTAGSFTNIDIGKMFDGCSQLTTLPTLYSGSNITFTNAGYAFRNCRNIQTINYVRLDASGSPTSQGVFVCDAYMFNGCSNLEDISGPQNQYILMDRSRSLNYAFQGCEKLTKVIVSTKTSFSIGDAGWGSSTQGTFFNCRALSALSSSSSSSYTISLYSSGIASSMFTNCSSLNKNITLRLRKPSRSSLTTVSTSSMFSGSGITGFTLASNSTQYSEDIESMFDDCRSLVSLGVMDLSKVRRAQYAFTACVSLSDDSLNNILASLATTTSLYTGTKTLKYVGLSSTQATTCTTLSNWAALSAAGWTTGY